MMRTSHTSPPPPPPPQGTTASSSSLGLSGVAAALQDAVSPGGATTHADRHQAQPALLVLRRRLAAFYLGVLPAVLRALPAHATVFGVFSVLTAA
mmetsp:Transcript_25567/g.101939  ORF Transcript_25567/g.101939 Transcript_25567/m.101939 type:complete len:95 (+) Transcript_25567:1328-1612(+)